MTRVVQIVPEMAPGSGVEAVAFHLEEAFLAQGVETTRFTLREARGDWLPRPTGGLRGRLALAARVVWFSTVGTVLARRFLRDLPDAVSICHNDVLAGDVYVNHGILKVAMRARGGFAWRMLRNPLHLFTSLRDALRYRSDTHRAVVNLMASEDRALRGSYPHLRPRTVVIGNGVDVDRYRPPTETERSAARAGLGLGPEALALVFVGHEFDRKGLPLILDAMVGSPDRVHLIVVGGSPDMLVRLRETAAARGLAERVHAVGRTPDPVPYFHAADVFVLPSAYESYGLVVLEAMACGLPVVVTDVGCVPDLVTPGENGVVVERNRAALRSAIRTLDGVDRALWGRSARRAAESHSWDRVAGEYLHLVEQVQAEKVAERGGLR